MSTSVSTAPLRALVALAAATAALAGAASGTASTAVRTPRAASVGLAAAAAQVRRELRGLGQRGLVLGDPRAAVSIIEYTDLDCPLCSRVHTRVLPAVIERFVRTGRASIELRAVATSARSRSLALGAYAATPQHRGWDLVQLAYLRSVQRSDAAPEAGSRLASALRLDLASWRRSLPDPEWNLQLRAARSVVAVARFTRAPVFLLRRRGASGPFVVLTAPGSVASFGAAIARAAHG